MDCLHLDVDNSGQQCAVCGADLPPFPNLGNITGIIHLIDSTAKTYLQLVKSNTDPNDASLPRLRMVGGQMLRVPHKAIYKDLLGPSYQAAKQLGYRGSLERWGEIIWEATPGNQPQL